MAAAEYYNGGMGESAASPAPNHGPPPPRVQALQTPQQYQQPNHLPYPISDAPPPYTPYDDASRPHSQPPPQSRVRFEDESRPSAGPGRDGYYNNHNSHRPQPQSYFSNEKFRPPPPAQSYAPNSYQQPQDNGYHPSQSYSKAPAVQSQGYLDPRAYRPPPHHSHHSRERSRSRSLDRRHKHRDHHSHRHREESSTKKKGSGVNTFLGAGGGALIGDAIFPGLGTLGGAILGGLGGHEYTKQKRDYNSSGRLGRRSHSTAEIDYYGDDHGRGRRR